MALGNGSPLRAAAVRPFLHTRVACKIPGEWSPAMSLDIRNRVKARGPCFMVSP